MIIEIKAPSPGESVNEVLLASWLVKNESIVTKDTEIAEIESEKATLAVTASEEGKIIILVEEGTSISPGEIICKIDTSFSADKLNLLSESSEKPNINKEIHKEEKIKITPLAKKIIESKNIDYKDIVESTSTSRIFKKDLINLINTKNKNDVVANNTNITIEKMSPLRQKLASRLVSVRNNTALTTTFNEINMINVIKIREEFGEKIKNKYGYNVGFVSFFAKAACIALKEIPVINAIINHDEIIFHHYVDLSIAVSTNKGLVTPVIRSADNMTIFEIESNIRLLAEKARNKRISPEDLNGGTFTISNGGVFGSMLSTPIINPPQSAVLGMHNIIERPVAINGNILIQPIMYVALSYDHRLIDGKDSVSFLIKIKELIENPSIMLEKKYFNNLF